jgi:peptidoglycan/LPS O-acetylase OafA/YrhL
MTEIRELILMSLAGILAFACAFAIYSLVAPPFTDAEIQQSFVDTWEVNAIITTASLAIVLVAGALSALLSWRGSRVAKRISVASVALSVAAACLLVLSHATLTERTTQLTGQEFGGILGLGLGPL